MRRVSFLFAVSVFGCNVYDSSLLASDGGPEACATTMCSGTCVDLASDKNNCGACGKTCETNCSGGLCTPTLLAGGLSAPHGIVLSGSSLYVADHGGITVQVLSAIDGTGLKTFATSQLFPDRLVTDGTTLFWTSDANVQADPGGSINSQLLSANGCGAPNACPIARNLPSPYGIALRGDTVFVTTVGSTNNGPSGCAGAWTNSVLSCSASTGCLVTGCATPGGPTVLASGQTKLAGIAVDANNLYFADSGAHVVRSCPQPACTGGAQTFAQIPGTPFDVVSDGANVYFTDRSGGNVYVCPTTGCNSTPTLFASGLDDPALLAVDATSVYVTSYANGSPGKGSISRCDLPSCTGGPVKVANKLKGPYGITLDSSYVYWAEEGSSGIASVDGSVSKLRRQ